MIRSFLLLFKIVILVAIVIWVAERPGTITIDWLQYKATFHVGFFILLMMFLVLIGIVIFSIIKAFFDVFNSNSSRNKDKGIKAVTIGLSAVAAGDSKNALYQAQRAKKFLGNKNALAKLLEAQAARLNGGELEAANLFTDLLCNKNAEFLGIRGLLQSALDSGDDKGALELVYRALKLYPRQIWLLQIAYDLEIKLHRWNDANKILDILEKYNAIEHKNANSDRVAMFLAQADIAKENDDFPLMVRNLKKAYRLDNLFIPTITRLGEVYLSQGKRKKVVFMVEKAWKARPHPDLVDLWGRAAPPIRDNDKMAYVRWFEKLLDFVPDSVEGLQALANVLISEGLWGEARRKLERAEEIRPNVNLYRIWARLEERATHDDSAVCAWLEKAANAPLERVWICSKTGRIYDRWSAISDQGLFNTIIWDFPQGREVNIALVNEAYIRPMLQPPIMK